MELKLENVKKGQRIIIKDKCYKDIQLHGEVVGYGLQFKLLSTGGIMFMRVEDYELLEVLEAGEADAEA